MREEKNNLFEQLIKETSLEIRLKVSNEMMFIMLLTYLGYREDKGWSDEDQHILNKLCKLAKEHTEHQLEQIKQWEDDGRPE